MVIPSLKNVIVGGIYKNPPCKLFKKFNPKIKEYDPTRDIKVKGKLNCCLSILIGILLIQF